jgi:hypothetical protein
MPHSLKGTWHFGGRFHLYLQRRVSQARNQQKQAASWADSAFSQLMLLVHHLQIIHLHILVGFTEVPCIHWDIVCGELCVAESDSESEDTEGVYYSVYEHRQRHRRKQQLEGSNQLGQSAVTVTLSVSQGVISLFAPVRVCITCWFIRKTETGQRSLIVWDTTLFCDLCMSRGKR